MPFRIDERDLKAFLVYAARERSLDSSQRNSGNAAGSEDHRKSIAALRELNRKMLFRETQHSWNMRRS